MGRYNPLVRGFINFIVSNPILLVVIIGGLFNLGVRLNQKAKEQRSKRAALAEIQRRKAEALRTGKPMTEPVIVYDEPQKKPQSAKNEDRQARIEALRQQRMAQLRAMREKRSGGMSQSPIGGATQQASSSQAAKPSSRTATPRPRTQRVPTLNQQTAAPLGQQRPRVVAPKPKPTPIPKATPGVDTPAPIKEIVPGKNPIAVPYGARPSTRDESDATSARSMLRDPKKARQAIVVREILDAPIGLRSPDPMHGGFDR